MTKELKIYKGEKYIYLAMAYELTKRNGKPIQIGSDNGYTGGQNYRRKFRIDNYDGKILLTETKNSKNFADFSRTFEITEGKRLSIKDYIDEASDNHGQNWIH